MDPLLHRGLLILIPAAALSIPLFLFWKAASPRLNNTTAVPVINPGNRAAGTVRPAAVAGQFYASDREELGRQVTELLKSATASATTGRITGLVVPHAGYQYSGEVAAEGFRQLEGRNFRTVILIGTSHNESFDGAAVSTAAYFQTPLGDAPVDQVITKRLTEISQKIIYRDSTHNKEHSLEVELPFLQKTLKDFKIVPVLLGQNSLNMAKELAGALRGIVDDNTLIVISSDLSHYPGANDAEKIDRQTISAILSGDPEKLDRTTQTLLTGNFTNLATTACGLGAVEILLALTGNDTNRQLNLLRYSNSYLAAGQDRERAVGYAAIVISSTKPSGTLSSGGRETLRKLARESVEGYVLYGKKPDTTNLPAELGVQQGAFVTLKKQGYLRGCIGTFSSDKPLFQTVSDMAVEAATRDNRFPPVNKEELDSLKYEISVLSPLKKVGGWRDVVLGEQGVQITNGGHSGVFLPQVYKDLGSDPERFFTELCTQKASLPRNCWQDPQTQFYIFTAEVF